MKRESIAQKNILSGNQKGYVVLITTFFVLVIMLGVAMSMSFQIANRQKSATNMVKSTQSYYASEAGVEDALLRLKKNPQMSSASYSFGVNGVTVNVVIPSTIGMSKSITSQTNNNGMERKIQAVCSINNGQEVSFYYGAQVGPGGLTMGNWSRIMGNVFSEGNISGSGIIDNDVVVSGNGHSIEGVNVEGDVLAYSCLSPADVDGNLTYVTGGAHTCTVHGTTSAQSQEISEQPLPIPQSQIDSWKSDAENARIITGNVAIANNQTSVLGPVKITGSLNIGNSATLKMTGTVYVVGNIFMGNKATIRLDASYGASGGVLLSDGILDVGNSNKFFGSGQAGSYLLILSTNTSDSAIHINNNSSGAVFYTSAGGIKISNNVSVAEATGYKITMENGSKIQYSSGIVNIYFTSGPGGGWDITSWQEY